ncbi:hypothetical protein FISHEDRAFT_34389 [Fistulina hepatica ATCC 64428]|uniref:2'-phosphotransferase n=1 Tax=Fistulina hepatica ATCC 64428 TaxID=1128425 RepID=A0A0D7AQA6_9AGAR|nr:hypothetical protein FISHEDRAFT_34389 [Fistulina hepatica ATCC 64428]
MSESRAISTTAPVAKQKGSNSSNRGGRGGGSSKLRGRRTDPPEVQLSKTLSWILRHGAKSEGLAMRQDGYVKVSDLLENKRVKSQALTFEKLQTIVSKDKKVRFDLVFRPETEGAAAIWWIKARQGHSLQDVKLDLKPILSMADIPSGIAVHGTTNSAWESIAKLGLLKMGRNHIHIAQGLAGDGVVSGMRNSSQVFIYIDVQKAIDAGIKFFLSDNGVILTEGDERGVLSTSFFTKVQRRNGHPVPGWSEEEIQTKVAAGTA